MGLPLFVAPVEPQIASKASEKPTAAPRSAIRRTRTLRGPHGRPHAAEARRRRIFSMVADSTPDEYEVWEMHRASPPSDGELTSGAQSQERSHRMFEAGRLRETLSFEHHHPRDVHITDAEMDLIRPGMPAVPESRDYFSIEDRQHRLRHISRRLAARNSAPTPPLTDTDIVSLPRIGSHSPRPVTLTPALSPVRHSVDRENPRENAEENARARRRANPPPSGADGSTRTSLSDRFQAINRSSMNSRRSTRQGSAARVDGLGDRDRSLSPEEGAAWDTLLTSITPDPQPPSAGSSFASAPSALAAASSGSAPTSASTSMTSMGSSEQIPTLHDCDMSDSTSSDDEEDLYELREFSSRRPRSWRSYADVVTTRDRTRAAESQDSGELEGMHMIISRMVESDNIPDEWWASAGLSRNLRREPSS